MHRQVCMLTTVLTIACGASDTVEDGLSSEQVTGSPMPIQSESSGHSTDSTKLISPPPEAINAYSCQSTSRCWLWSRHLGTFYRGHFLWCGC